MSLLGTRLHRPLERASLGAVALLALLMVSPLAQASLSDDVIGSYSGNVTYSQSGSCIAITSEVAPMDLEVTKLGTNSFKGTGTLTTSQHTDAVVLNMTGTTPTTFNFNWTLAEIGGGFSGSGSGSLLTDAISISASGGSLCTVTFSGTLAKVSGAGAGAEQAQALQNTTEAVLQYATNTVANVGKGAVLPKGPNDLSNVSNALVPIAGGGTLPGHERG